MIYILMAVMSAPVIVCLIYAIHCDWDRLK
jgi:hypothetical protein